MTYFAKLHPCDIAISQITIFSRGIFFVSALVLVTRSHALIQESVGENNTQYSGMLRQATPILSCHYVRNTFWTYVGARRPLL